MEYWIFYTAVLFPWKKKTIIKTFLGSARKSLNELELCVKLPNFGCSVPFLVDKCLDLQFHVKGLSAAARNIITGGSKLAVDFSYVRNDCLSEHGLIEVYVLKYIGPMQLIHFIEFPRGIVPFDKVSDFLCPVVDATDSDVSSINYSQAVADNSQCPVTHDHFELDPKSDYFDPFDSFTKSSVERPVDKLYSSETLGIVGDSVSDYHWDKIASFCSSISHKDNFYSSSHRSISSRESMPLPSDSATHWPIRGRAHWFLLPLLNYFFYLFLEVTTSQRAPS